MTVFDTLRAAAHALGDRTDRAHAPALAGLLQNRADDMERNFAIWQGAGQDVPALVDKYYGVYLTVATAVLVDRKLATPCVLPTKATVPFKVPSRIPTRTLSTAAPQIRHSHGQRGGSADP